jgi:hypothetical protein
MQRAPWDPKGFILDTLMLWRIGGVSILQSSGGLGLFYWQHTVGGEGLELGYPYAAIIWYG